MFNVYNSVAVHLKILDSLSDYDSKYVENCIKQTNIYKKITQHITKSNSSGYTSLYNNKRNTRKPIRNILKRNVHSYGTKKDQDNSICPLNIIKTNKIGKVTYGKHQIIEDIRTGDKVCTVCGLIIDDMCIETGKGIRIFTSEERKKKDHYGAPSNEFSYDKGLPTHMGNISKDFNGKMLSADKQILHKRLKKWDQRYKITDNKQVNFNRAINLLKRYSNPIVLDLPNFVQREVAHFYKIRVLKNDIMKNREVEPTVLTLIYLVCQKHKMPKTPEQICEKVGYDVTNFNRSRHKIMHLLNIKAAPIVPTDYVNKICNDLNIDNQNLRTAAIRILKKTFNNCEKKNLLFKSGKNPAAIAAAAIYIACLLTNTKRTQDQIAKTGSITNVTLRTRYQEILKIIDVDPKDIRG